ncbi:MAG: ComF family protein [Gammaproteobacteria bacterium]|nr:ComF family protein [Gammaproteobacteria bacterium]MBU1481544.1 ComF family protein [Gammaproteobacteria bacterium]
MSILSHHSLDIGAKFARMLPAQPCLLCGASSHDGLCCAACAADLPRLSAEHCPVCALPTLAGSLCGHCLKQPPPFDHTVAAFGYKFPLDKLIQALKYRDRLILVNFLAEALVQRITTQPDCIVALPLHAIRLRERGFNQSLLLAHQVSRRVGIPLLADACNRVRNTPPQSSLPWKERDKNMRQAFACKPGADVRGKHVAVVDDVMTSGASIGELARALKKAGAKEVSAWVAARTLPHS